MRILLSRTDRLGDLILSTPAIASVRRSWPAAHVTIAVSRYNAPAVAESPDVDRILALPSGIAPEHAPLDGPYDLAIALAPRAFDFRVVRVAHATRRIGYTYATRYLARLTARTYLTDLLVSEADPVRAEGENERVRHEVDQMLALVVRAGGRTIAHDLVLPVGGDARARAAELVPDGAIVVHLAPRWLREGSTLASVVALLGELRAFARPIVLTHGSDVADEARAIAAAGVADAILGDLAFSTWAAVFARASVIVTVDTGATHVASAMRRPTVVLFEHRYFRLCSQEWAPYRVPSVMVRKPAGDDEPALRASRGEIVAGVDALLSHHA